MAAPNLGTILPSVNVGKIDWVLIGGICLVILILAIIGVVIYFLIQKRKFNILVEVTPYWAIKEAIVDKIETKEPSRFEKLLGKTNKPKQLIYQDITQTSQSYFVKGKYRIDNKNGTYYLKLKGQDNAKIQGIDYKYFKPISYGSALFPINKYIHLLRYSPADYKPIESRFSSTGLKELKNAYDSEATYVSLATQQEVIARYRKTNMLLTYLPWIFALLIMITFIIAIYILSKQLGGFAKQLGGFTAALGELTKTLLATSA